MIKDTNKAQVTKVSVVPKKYYSANENNKTKKINEIKNIALQKASLSVFGEKQTKIFARTLVAFLCLGVILSMMGSILSFGYTVKVDDTVLGTVASKGDYYEVLDEVKTEVRHSADVEFEPEGEESFTFEIVTRNRITGKDELAENLKSTSEDMTEAATIVADGKFVVALTSEEDANEILDTYLASYTGENENITAEFACSVLVETGYAHKNSIMDKNDAYSELLAGKSVLHEVAENETIADIAEKHNTTEESILQTNGLSLDDEIFGEILKIYIGEPILSVKTVEHIAGEFEIPFETETKEDKNLYRGRTEVETEGKTGVKFVESYITRINGVITEENIIEDRIIKSPVMQVERMGTKEPPPSMGTGEFVMPTSGQLTSRYGSRWGRTHAGIDVGAKTGTPIFAADNGIVTEAQYKNNGYGNFISVDHGNGYVTYYAHCSEISVSKGDVVAKGDLIGKVGSTGRSTGPHLHFEIRLNGEAKNPLNYVK